MLRRPLFFAGMGVVFCLAWCFVPVVQAASFKVLVVMSYEETYPTTPEYKEGIKAVLGDTCEIRYFQMDTKQHLEAGPEKAKEAYALYEEFQPDGVIAADDNAQSMFVVPYLKDKVKTPVMFCGVNAEAKNTDIRPQTYPEFWNVCTSGSPSHWPSSLFPPLRRWDI